MKVESSPENVTVTLSKAFDNRAKILNFVYFLVFSGTALPFVLTAINLHNVDSITVLLVFGGGAAYLFAAYRFLNKAFQSEQLVATKDVLEISRKSIFSKSAESYQSRLIKNFRHLDKPKITDHPLAGGSFDYLGFQTQQAVINEMHGDDRMGFDYEGKTIKFGDNIYSWEYEELYDALKGLGIQVGGGEDLLEEESF